MTKERKIYRQTFWLDNENKKGEWPFVHKAIAARLEQGGCQIIIDERFEKRREVQNRLAHVWKGQIAKHMGYENDYAWGMLKWDILLPLKRSEERHHTEAEKEHYVVLMTSKYLKELPEYKDAVWREIIVETANEYVVSSDIAMNVFSEFLYHIQLFAAKGGLALRSTNEDLRMAHGKDHELKIVRID